MAGRTGMTDTISFSEDPMTTYSNDAVQAPGVLDRVRNRRLSIVVPPASLVWVAVGLVVVGFGLLAYTWVKVSTLTIVAAQIPYIVSAGLTGLGLITVGSAVLVVWSRRSDDGARREQTDELVSTLKELRDLEANR
jgi:hypothetical protein